MFQSAGASFGVSAGRIGSAVCRPPGVRPLLSLTRRGAGLRLASGQSTEAQQRSQAEELETWKNAPPPPSRRPSRTARGKIFAGTAAIAAAVLWYATAADAVVDDGDNMTNSAALTRGLSSEPMAPFAPFVVAAREPVSPGAFVLTLRPAPGTTEAALARTRAAVEAAWARRGTWAVEVKQPQLQIAREYTPLPGVDAGDVRLFVRVVPGGEVSRYLAQRPVGAVVGLRGPRPGFDVARRLGVDVGAEDGPDSQGAQTRHVVFLAAGTGIAPALQVADAVLRADANAAPAAVTILWASRRHQDSDGGDLAAPSPLSSAPNPVVADLRALQRRYGRDRLQVRCFADDQHTFITEADVCASLGFGGAGASASWWPWRGYSKAAAVLPPADADCGYHGAKALERLEADPVTPVPCSCRGPASTTGRNLLIVSGPDGFVSAWAGPKHWASGKERQGAVGGILGALRARHPDVLDDWLVLKL